MWPAARSAFRQQQPLPRCLPGMLWACRLCVAYRCGAGPQCRQSTVDQSPACCWDINTLVWLCVWLTCYKLALLRLEGLILLHEYCPVGGLSLSQLQFEQLHHANRKPILYCKWKTLSETSWPLKDKSLEGCVLLEPWEHRGAYGEFLQDDSANKLLLFL